MLTNTDVGVVAEGAGGAPPGLKSLCGVTSSVPYPEGAPVRTSKAVGTVEAVVEAADDSSPP